MAKNKFANREIKLSHIDNTPSKKQENLMIVNLDTSILEDNLYQPRIEYDEAKLLELANSIKTNGQQSPIKVTNSFYGVGVHNKYMIVYGHRRTRACKMLGIQVKAFIDDISKADLRSLALIENIQRDDLSVIELAISFNNAINDGTFSTYQQIAKATGYSEAKISNLLNILKLESRITQDLEQNRQVKDIYALSMLNKVQNRHTAWTLYKDFRDGNIDRKNLINLINSENIKTNSQCELTLNKSKTSFYFKPSKELTQKGKYNEYERFAKEKLEQLKKELEEKEKELLQ